MQWRQILTFRSVQGLTEIAGLDNGGLDIDGLENGGLDIDGLDIAGLDIDGRLRRDGHCRTGQ